MEDLKWNQGLRWWQTVILQLRGDNKVERLATLAPVKIPAASLNSGRGGAQSSRLVAAQTSRGCWCGGRGRLKSERGKCSHSHGLWTSNIAAGYSFCEVISCQNGKKRQSMWLTIKTATASKSLVTCPLCSLCFEEVLIKAVRMIGRGAQGHRSSVCLFTRGDV